MSAIKFPKVLILCDKFDNYTGMGVTLTNLFQDWPADSIALAGYGIDKELCEMIRPCHGYFPLEGHFVSRKNSAGQVRKSSKLRAFAKTIYDKLGVSDFIKIEVSDELKSFIAEFNPDIIYAALGDLKRVRFAEAIHKLFPTAKLALYIVDDWPDSRFAGRWLERLWRKSYDSATKRIIRESDIRLSICQKMSDVYLKRYGASFIPFHNPVNLSYWNSITRTSKYGDDVFSIVYVGKINRDTKDQLISLAGCVEKLNKEGRKVKFDIYTPSPIPEDLRQFEYTEVKCAVSNTEIPALLKAYSMLFLTLGFSAETRNYVKLSMPTKLTEYLASGTPILLYAPAEIALTEYLSQHDAAFVCTEERSLPSALSEAIDKTATKEKIVANATTLVSRHDAVKIREDFRKALTE